MALTTASTSVRQSSPAATMADAVPVSMAVARVAARPGSAAAAVATVWAAVVSAGGTTKVSGSSRPSWRSRLSTLPVARSSSSGARASARVSARRSTVPVFSLTRLQPRAPHRNGADGGQDQRGRREQAAVTVAAAPTSTAGSAAARSRPAAGGRRGLGRQRRAEQGEQHGVHLALDQRVAVLARGVRLEVVLLAAELGGEGVDRRRPGDGELPAEVVVGEGAGGRVDGVGGAAGLVDPAGRGLDRVAHALDGHLVPGEQSGRLGVGEELGVGVAGGAVAGHVEGGVAEVLGRDGAVALDAPRVHEQHRVGVQVDAPGHRVVVEEPDQVLGLGLELGVGGVRHRPGLADEGVVRTRTWTTSGHPEIAKPGS